MIAIIIGIDHGYYAIKTRQVSFPSGIIGYDYEPYTMQNVLQYQGYIFVNEKEPDRPMQYMAIKTKVMSMIQEKQLKDDHGELFGFGTHMFRHYYGVKLTEMHLDDWTIARLLGHKRLNNVQHYRKMSNQRMADETREVRQMMSDIIYMSLARWGEEYEQIRQDD